MKGFLIFSIFILLIGACWCEMHKEDIIYGELPKFSSESEKKDFLLKLDILGNSIKEKKLLKKYFYPNGPVIAYGHDISGCFVVFIEKNMKVKEKTLNEIYEIIVNESKKHNIKKLCIVFRFENRPSLDVREVSKGSLANPLVKFLAIVTLIILLIITIKKFL